MVIRRSTWQLAAIFFLSWCAFATRPGGWTQLAAMLSVLVAITYLLTLAGHGIFKWREQALGSLLSCLLIIFSFPAAVASGHMIRGMIFKHNLERWNQAVVWVTSHSKPNQEGPVKLPRQYSDLAKAVHYNHDRTCGLMIDFFWGGGFPVKHTVRRFALNDAWIDIKECRTDWSRGRTIATNWYEISD